MGGGPSTAELAWGLNQSALVVALLVRMIPGILLVIPLYITLAHWGLLDTRLGLILIYTGLNTSFVIWMMQSFIAEIPRDIEEAAMVDGDSRLTALWRVVVPLAAPGLAATAISGGQVNEQRPVIEGRSGILQGEVAH
jgi:multiple sugar transport system permease protein